MQKSAIAVYDPKDSWERAIQDAAKQFLGEWLPSFACQTVAEAVGRLKILSGWMDKPELYNQRAQYFFSPQFTSKKSQMVFATHLLFFRDILENREINSYLHDPITFVTRPIAHYLLKEYPIHVIVDYDRIKSDNPDNKFLDIAGLLVSKGKNVALSSEAILDVRIIYDPSQRPDVEPAQVNQIQSQTGLKAAAKSISRGVFQIDEHNRVLMPKMKVWDKVRRADAEIYLVEPGDTGMVGILYSDGTELTVSKLFFDTRYSVV